MGEWIQKRLANEIELCELGNGQFGLILIDEREALLESLAPESLSDEETELRTAVLGFLESWTYSSPPTFKDAKASYDVQQCLNAVFVHGHGSPESLRLWVERRIGAEILTQKVGEQWTLALRENVAHEDEDEDEKEEQISGEELLAMQKRLQEKKRKAEGQNGKA